MGITYTFEIVESIEELLANQRESLERVMELRKVSPNSAKLIRLMFAHKRAIRALEMRYELDNLAAYEIDRYQPEVDASHARVMAYRRSK